MKFLSVIFLALTFSCLSYAGQQDETVKAMKAKLKEVEAKSDALDQKYCGLKVKGACKSLECSKAANKDDCVAQAMKELNNSTKFDVEAEKKMQEMVRRIQKECMSKGTQEEKVKCMGQVSIEISEEDCKKGKQESCYLAEKQKLIFSNMD